MYITMKISSYCFIKMAKEFQNDNVFKQLFKYFRLKLYFQNMYNTLELSFDLK